MQDQWGNEITVEQTETDWVFTRGGSSVSFPLDRGYDKSSASALATFNGMCPS